MEGESEEEVEVGLMEKIDDCVLSSLPRCCFGQAFIHNPTRPKARSRSQQQHPPPSHISALVLVLVLQ